MLQNSSITAFTVFALLRKNQLGGGNKPPTTQIRVNLYERQKHVTYAKESFVMIKIRKENMPFIINSEIIATTLENLEELLIKFAI